MKFFDYKSFSKNNISLEKDVFEYGIKILERYIKFIVFTLASSLILGLVFEWFVFLMLFLLLRRYIGGLHLYNSQMCLIASSLITIFLSFMSKSINISDLLFILIWLISIILIKLFAPIDHSNKRIIKIEKRLYKNKALKISFVYLGIFLICNYIGVKMICNSIFWVIFLCVFLLLIPIFRQKYLAWRGYEFDCLRR